LKLDAEDLEMLGYGGEALLYEMAAEASRLQQATAESQRGRNVDNYHFRHKRTNLARVKAWRAQQPEKYRAIERLYKQSEKGKKVRAEVNRRQYLRMKADPLASAARALKVQQYQAAYRARKKAQREQEQDGR